VNPDSLPGVVRGNIDAGNRPKLRCKFPNNGTTTPWRACGRTDSRRQQHQRWQRRRSDRCGRGDARGPGRGDGRGGRPPALAVGRDPEPRAHVGGAAAGDEGPALPGDRPEREAELHTAGGSRAHRFAPGRGRQAHTAAERVWGRRRQERRRHGRRARQRSQDEGAAAPRGRSRAARTRCRGGAQRELRSDRGSPPRGGRRGRHPQRGHGRRRPCDRDRPRRRRTGV